MGLAGDKTHRDAVIVYNGRGSKRLQERELYAEGNIKSGSRFVAILFNKLTVLELF